MTISTPYENDFLIHRRHNRHQYYRDQPSIRYSFPTRKWFVFSPELIDGVLRDHNFHVQSYDRRVLADRFGIPNEFTKAINDTLPLSAEGDTHRSRRERVARQIASKSAEAKAVFSNLFELELRKLQSLKSNFEICLVKDVFLSPVRGALLTLADLIVEENTPMENLPLFFDDAISLRKRVALENTIHETLKRVTAPIEQTAKLEALGLVIVSINTLLGTLVGSVAEELARHERKSLNQINWSKELSFTSLPYVERVCQADTTIGNEKIRKGDVLRLFLDVVAFDHSLGDPNTDLFFAVGLHKCLGIGFSKAIWQIVVERLSKLETVWTLQKSTYRSGDHVFNFFDSVKVLQNG